MHFLSQYGLFALETMTLVIAILLLVAGILSLGRKPRNTLRIDSLDKEYHDIKHKMQKETFGKKIAIKKKDKKNYPSRFVLDFKGDIMASQVEQLRQEVSALLSIATKNDEVVIRLMSPGGSVNGYGLAAAQLQRIRDRHIPLTVCIDQVAASGGYLMACVANRIIAAPFSIIGSIGVVAQVPNFHRLLKKNNIDVELLTAGEHKRTLTMFGENTESGRKKFKQDLEQIHAVFRNYILTNRQNVNIDQVATGEHWLAVDALNLGLIDKVQTSDDYLDEQRDAFNTYGLSLPTKQPLTAKLLKPFAQFFQAY
jgi:serine protease SohB